MFGMLTDFSLILAQFINNSDFLVFLLSFNSVIAIIHIIKYLISFRRV